MKLNFYCFSAAIFFVLMDVSLGWNVPYQKMEAENYDSNGGGINYQESCSNGGKVYSLGLGPTDQQSYYRVDFGSKGAEKVTVAISTYMPYNVSGVLNLHLDNPYNAPFASLIVRYTGSGCPYKNISTYLSSTPTQVHDLYFTLATNDYEDIVYVDWFAFTESYLSPSSVYVTRNKTSDFAFQTQRIDRKIIKN